MIFPIRILQVLLVIALAVFGMWLLVKILMAIGWTLGQLFRGIGLLARRIGAFVVGMVSDTLRVVGGVLTAAFFVPAILFNVAVGRWSRANHYARALQGEVVGLAQAVYRVGVGHVAQLLGLRDLTDGFERRIPEVMARAPGPDRPSRPDAFEGYTIVGSLPSGGSGARLFLAEPGIEKREQLLRSGLTVPARVVIKSFSLADGSTLPQIVRESRALEAARQLGLVLEHELGGGRFHYVMPYVPGDDLGEVARRLHDQAGPEGLRHRQLSRVLGYTADLLQILQRFHAHGLWHKDIKPSNIIISDGRAHLVDLGLTTPLRSAMTLTTHGTEYFRDPELVRLALKGVKVHEVDGVKFDIYGVGAVLYSLVENSFPAHGNLSQIHRRCPDALRWVIRKAMADMTNRYASAPEMLADVQALLAARDPFKVKPARLPSMRDGSTGQQAASAFGPIGVPPSPADWERPSPRGVRGAVGEAVREARDAARQAVHEARSTARQAVHEARDAARSAKGWCRKDERRRERRARRGGVGPALGAAALVLFALFVVQRAPFGSHAVAHGPSYELRGEVAAGSAVASRSVSTDRSAAREVALQRTLPESLRLASHRVRPRVVLLLDDVPEKLPAPRQDRLQEVLDSMEQARFELVGMGREHALDSDTAMGLEAEARATLGLGDPRDPEIAVRLQDFLTTHEDTLDAVVWLGRSDRTDELAWRAAAADDVDASDLELLLGGMSR